MKLAEIIERIRAIDHLDAQALADELEPNPPGRPPATLERMLRLAVSKSLYGGSCPVAIFPSGAKHLPSVSAAKGNWTAADGLTADLFKVSERTIRAARSWRLAETTYEEIYLLEKIFRLFGDAEELEKNSEP